MAISIKVVDAAFKDWQALLDLLFAAFDFQHQRIDPPSSLLKLNLQTIAEKSKSERLYIAVDDGVLLGCVFVKKQPDFLYVGKLAVVPNMQGRGIGQSLMQEVERYASSINLHRLELQVRIELTENQAAFAAMGFVEIGRSAHPGFSQMTSVTMGKML